jgi:transposase
MTYRLRLNVIKAVLGNWKLKKIANRFEISRQSVYDIKNKYLKYGLSGLEDHKTGKLRNPLHPTFYVNIIDLKKKYSWGACKIETFFRKKGFFVSHNKINQVLQYEGLVKTKMGKREKPKYISYEAENINEQWHIDWSIDPLTKKKLLAIIDDKSRFLVYAGLYDEATAKNSAKGLQIAINVYGAPKELVSDNGTHFKKAHSKRTPNKAMKELEEKYEIKHIFIRPYHPQSNGKIERWFGSYKGEFPRMNYEKVYDCLTYVEYYNYERIHQSLNYETPAHIYLGVKSI